MRNFLSLPSTWARCLVVLAIPCLVLALGEYLVGGRPAQGAAKPPPEEEEEAPAKKPTPHGPAKKPLKEVEDTAKPPRHKGPLRVPEQESTDTEPADEVEKPESPGPNSLARAAQKATDPEVKELFRQLSHPYDMVYLHRGFYKAVPIAQYIGSTPDFKGNISIRRYREQWEPGPAFDINARAISEVKPFEEIAVESVDGFLKKGLPREGVDGQQAHPSLEKLDAAEKALGAVLSFHQSAVERGRRTGSGWKAVGKQLRGKLIDVQLERLPIVARTKSWDDVYEMAQGLVDTNPDNKKVQLAFIRLMAEHAGQSLIVKDYAQTLRSLKLLEAQDPDAKEAASIRRMLSNRAQELYHQAELHAEKEPNKAIDLLEQAERIWPSLKDLHDYRLRLSDQYPILYVGVPSLPRHLSPATAATDSERQAVELLFESLLKPSYDEKVGQRYHLGLAATRPRLVPVGREFELIRDAYWYDPATSEARRVTGADVRNTVDLLRSRGRAGLVEKARLGDNAFHVRLTLSQGCLDPLAMMAFKIVPAGLEQIDDPKFAKHPVGSGPFVCTEHDENHAVFMANPQYHRAGKPGLPRIREIHFFRSDNPAADFNGNRLDLLLGLTSADIRGVESVAKVQTMRNRRIYFLAVNHRVIALRNPDLRRAIAHAIDREQILTDVFRSGSDYKDENDKPAHRALNGPYAPGSWAYKPDLPPLDPSRARRFADRARGAVRGTTFTLKYPKGDDQALRACSEISDEVLRATGFKLEVVEQPPTPDELRHQVEVSHEYEFAYYHYDYPAEDCWLWPMFDPSVEAKASGGSNFLGYDNDGDLTPALRVLNGHRQVKEVREAAHKIHQLFYDRMPFIPLWQLDTHIAFRSGLTMTHVDPLLIFNDVEHWTLQKR